MYIIWYIGRILVVQWYQSGLDSLYVVWYSTLVVWWYSLTKSLTLTPLLALIFNMNTFDNIIIRMEINMLFLRWITINTKSNLIQNLVIKIRSWSWHRFQWNMVAKIFLQTYKITVSIKDCIYFNNKKSLKPICIWIWYIIIWLQQNMWTNGQIDVALWRCGNLIYIYIYIYIYICIYYMCVYWLNKNNLKALIYLLEKIS